MRWLYELDQKGYWLPFVIANKQENNLPTIAYDLEKENEIASLRTGKTIRPSIKKLFCKWWGWRILVIWTHQWWITSWRVGYVHRLCLDETDVTRRKCLSQGSFESCRGWICAHPCQNYPRLVQELGRGERKISKSVEYNFLSLCRRGLLSNKPSNSQIIHEPAS